MLRTLLLLSVWACTSLILHGQTQYEVNTIDDIDDGVCNAIHCSLREAINASNTDNQSTLITFRISSGPATIFLNDALPRIIDDSTVIDGTTQTGLPAELSIDCGGIGVQTQDIISIFGDYTEIYGIEIFNYTISENPMLEGAGNLIGVGGIFILASPIHVIIGAPGKGNALHTVIRTRISRANYGNGIGIHSGEDVIVQNNRIGTNYDADQILPIFGEGIRVDEINFGSSYIGGNRPGEANIIGNCNRGIGLFGGQGWVQGNFIGTDSSLTIALPNRSDGIIVNLGDFYEIGGTNPESGNYCYNNASHGISINTIITNYIGYNHCGNNGFDKNGISILNCPDCLVENNVCFGQLNGILVDDIGNTRVTLFNNEVYDNTGDGIQMNWPPTATDIVATQNSHYCNGAGIGVGIKGPTSPFSNLSVNSISSSQVIGVASPNSLIELFLHDTTGCSNAICQGKYYIGNTTSDATGIWSFNGPFIPNRFYVCTQTLPQKLTSPFDACFKIPDCTTIVTHTGDSGNGSLREAINCANSLPGPDTISFDIPGAQAEYIIQPLSELPAITDEATMIDATTQPTGIVIVDGSMTSPFTTGLVFHADSSELYGLNIRNFGLVGVEFGENGTPINFSTIGSPLGSNTIYQCGNCLDVYAGVNVTIQSNILGNDATYSSATMPSNFGCKIETINSSNNILFGGRKSFNEGNTIINNSIAGVQIISGDDFGQVEVYGNFFGTDNNQSINQGNCSSGSVDHGALTVTTTAGSKIGSGRSDEGNVFAHNLRPGIYAIFDGHFIRNNSFYCNELDGIDLNSQGQMANQNKPSPSIMIATMALVEGSASPSDTIELYIHGDPACPDAICQGKTLIGKTLTNSAGVWSIGAPFSVAPQNQDFITAIAYNFQQNTSEFSECVQICPEVDITVSNNGPYCPGDTVFLFSNVQTNNPNVGYNWTGPNGYMSVEQNPVTAFQSGTYFLQVTVDGCLYPIVETEVIIGQLDSTLIDTLICSTDQIIIGVTVFDISNPSGQVIMMNQSQCDSIVFVDLKFNDGFISTLFDTICENEFISFRGERYDINNPKGGDTLINKLGCDSIYSVELFMNPITRSTINKSLCFGDSIIINGKKYNENNPNGKDTLSNQNGCDSVITIQLTFGSGRTNDVDTTLCEGDFIVLNNVMYDANNPIGNDTIFMGASDQCDSIISVSLSFRPLTKLTIDTTLCSGGFLNFNNIRYDQFHSQGIDTLKGQSKNGCDSVISVILDYYDPQFELDTIHPTCVGKDDGEIIIKSIDGIPGPYKVTFNGNGPLNIDMFPFSIDRLDEGNYIVVITDNTNCNHSFQIELIQDGNLDVTTPPDIRINTGEIANLTFQSSFIPDSIFWILNGDTLCRDCDIFSISPSESTTYELWVYEAGCFVMKTITVVVEVDFSFYFPNIFSPDGNNINDRFNGHGASENVKIESLEIYSRWGELIFKGLNINPGNDKGWDGTYNGERVLPGVYVYKAKISFPGGISEMRIGEITLVY